MGEINFLSNKKDADSLDKNKIKKGLEKDVKWIEPTKDKEVKEAVLKDKPAKWFSFFKKFSPEKGKSSKIDQLSRIKDSRQAVLKQIQTDSVASKIKQGKYKEKKKKRKSNLLPWPRKDNIKESGKNRKVTVDYQELFKKEAKRKKGEPELIQRKVKGLDKQKDIESKLAKSKKGDFRRKAANFFNRLFSKNKIKEEDKIKEPDKLKEEIKSENHEEENAKQESEGFKKQKGLRSQSIIGANLIKDEIVTFFDWKKNLVVLFSFIITSCLLIGIAYGLLMYWEKQKREQREITTEKSSKLASQIRQFKSEENEIFIFQKRLKKAAGQLEQHIYWTNFFKFLESYIIKDVYLYNFGGNTSGYYTIPAWAKDFKTLAKQIKIFRALDNVKEIQVTGGGVSEASGVKGINFSLIISIDPKIFYR